MACIGCYTENEASWERIGDRYEKLDQVRTTIKRSDLDQNVVQDLKIFEIQMQSELDSIKDHWENVHCDGTWSAFCEIQDQHLEMFDKWYRRYLRYLKDHQIKSKDWENQTHQILNDHWNEPVRKTLNLLTIINYRSDYHLEAILKTNPKMQNHRVVVIINTKASFDDQRALAIINQEINQLLSYLVTNVDKFLDYAKTTCYDWKIKLEWQWEWNQNQVPIVNVWLKTGEHHNCPLVVQNDNSQLILTNHWAGKRTRLLRFINVDWWKYPVLIDQDLKTQLEEETWQQNPNPLGFTNNDQVQQKAIKQWQNLRFKFPIVLKLINDKFYLCFAKDWLAKNLVMHYDAKKQNLWKLTIDSQSEYGFAASEIDQHQLDQISANIEWIWDHQGWSLNPNHFKMIETISEDD